MSIDGCRVLLVEDELLIGMLVADMLADLGCELAATAEQLDAALALAGSLRFDIALVDLRLGGLSTYPVADVLKERGIPFAFVTGRDRSDIDTAYADIPILQKPFHLSGLAAVLARLLAASRGAGLSG